MKQDAGQGCAACTVTVYGAAGDDGETVARRAHVLRRQKVYTMFANNHHNDGHVAVWIPAASGMQEALIQSWPDKFYRPPYVGVKGWVGIELERVSDEELAAHVSDAYRLIAPKKRVTARSSR